MRFNRFIFPILLLFMMISPVLYAQVQKSPDDLLQSDLKLYGIEQARIKYEYSGKASGYELVEFADYGWRSKTYAEKKIQLFQNPTTTKDITLRKGNLQASYGPGSQYVSVFPERHVRVALENRSPAADNLIAEQILQNKEAKQVGTEEVLGKTCTVYEVKYEGKKVWVWEGIILKWEQPMMDGKIVCVATKIEDDYKMNPDVLSLPENAVINGMDWE